ncbi:unnamed protein product [Brugia timori]|uniref:Uncharacterized protein n=1 Tax=Brugia timori TaxID=42155 RepID=A0A0R3R9T0_9BILA|nr:unnamed protein product [Brugia timori]
MFTNTRMQIGPTLISIFTTIEDISRFACRNTIT